MGEWKEVIATEFCKEVTDGTHDSPKPVSKGKYLLTSKHLQEFQLDFANAYQISQEDYEKAIARSKVDQFDVLFSMIGTIGTIHRVTIKDVDFAVKNMGIFKVGGDDIKSKWLYYWLKTRNAKEYINSCLSGTTQGYLTLKALRNFPIQVPSEKTMGSIVSILSSLDSKIENNRKICANLEAQAQALFKHWFIDFAPFKDGKFVESELGMIPEGWRVGTLGEIAEVSSGKRPLERFDTETEEHNVPLIGASCVMGYTNEAFMSTKILLTGRVGTLGVIQRFNNACWPSDNTLVLTTQFYEFVYQTLKTLNYSGMNRGTSQPLITQGDLKKTSIIIPPNEVINEFEDTSSKLMSILEQNNKESKILSFLRDTLLPKLMSGAIKV